MAGTVRVALVTGADGFIGSHVRRRLAAAGWEVRVFERSDPEEGLDDAVRGVDAIVHLAGVNRPDDDTEFDRVNHQLTTRLVDAVIASGGTPTVIFSSSIHVAEDSPYGRSKAAAERELERLARAADCAVLVDRLPGVYGPGQLPDYNSVVATFCHRIARDEPIEVRDPDAEVELVEVGGVVDRWMEAVAGEPAPGFRRLPAADSDLVSVGELADRLSGFARLHRAGYVPDTSDPFAARLFSTLVSHFDPEALSTELRVHSDDRGWLAELLKSDGAGQIFVSSTRPGVTRGNHFHHAKVEKFFVISGDAVIRLRQVGDERIHAYPVSSDRPSVVDIPPGYVHNIENVGDSELIVLFWANEVFDPESPDTTAEEVSP
jgi:UDP-2-acetamido-2,6-beta-L-arabino-hexul-4-ose reductase